METFDADWLALREPLDHTSRAKDLIAPLVHAWDTGGWSRVLDLGSGTGSNLRYLAPRLPPEQDWVLVDHDPAHLRTLRALKRPPGVRSLTVSSRDLATHELADVAGADLVTASALLDLTSEHWLDRLVTACVGGGCGVLCALTYSGWIDWSDERSDASSVGPRAGSGETAQDDLLVREAVNAHQAGDKGFGPALGPAAAALAERRFQSAGYRTTLQESAWRLGGADRPIVEQLLAGWVEAAVAVRPGAEARMRLWAEAKRAVVATGAFSLTVGHHDLLALPPDRP
jgi:SAM-dependent methyltransferase